MEEFYYYHNPNVNPHLTIHRGTCGDCQDGKGKHKNVERGNRCVWAGPFHDINWMYTYIQDNLLLRGYEPTFCSKCLSEYQNIRVE